MMETTEEQVRRLPWLKSFLQAKFYNYCESHNKYYNYFCGDCTSTICEKCKRQTNKHIDHKILQVYRASGDSSIQSDTIKTHLNIDNIQPYTINSVRVVYINQRHGKVEQNCRTEFKYCSIECKIKSETSLMEEPDVPKVTNASALNAKRKIVQPPVSFRKRSRKGIPIRSPFF